MIKIAILLLVSCSFISAHHSWTRTLSVFSSDARVLVTEACYVICPDRQEQIDNYCYGSCPLGYTPADSYGYSATDPLLFSDIQGPQVFCWQNCPNNLSDDQNTCKNYTDYGYVSQLPDRAFGDSDSRFAGTQEDCQFDGTTCEQCPGGWIPISPCGPCAETCPTTCPSDMIQDGNDCKKRHIDRSITAFVCPPSDGEEDLGYYCLTDNERELGCWTNNEEDVISLNEETQ